MDRALTLIAMAADANTRRRVKLYMLNESRVWDDQGTGHVAPITSEKDAKSSVSLIVRSEVDGTLTCLLYNILPLL